MALIVNIHHRQGRNHAHYTQLVLFFISVRSNNFKDSSGIFLGKARAFDLKLMTSVMWSQIESLLSDKRTNRRAFVAKPEISKPSILITMHAVIPPAAVQHLPRQRTEFKSMHQ